MTNMWKKVFEGKIDERDIVIEEYDEGGYRAKTIQGEDYEGYVSSDETGTMIIPPSSAGTSIVIEGETKEELSKEMAQEGFSEESIKKVLDGI
jgi:hypothetical protein